MDERVWHLPGPRGVIRDALREFDRRRHVAIVLPHAMAEDSTITGGLVQELVRELNRIAETQELPPDPDASSLLNALSRALVWEDYPPATLSDLLAHQSTYGRVVVLLASDLPKQQQDELPELLRRLETETRPVPASERLTLVCVGHRGHLPHFAGGESSDVNLATVWWWNRVARWDVAAHISHDVQQSGARVLSDVRSETIVEIAKWDLDMAELLEHTWSGDPSSINDCLTTGKYVSVTHDVPEGAGTCGRRPSKSVIDHWDAGHLDGWHDAHHPHARVLLRKQRYLDRLVWAAQARILMPWIEERRAALHDRTIEALGDEAFEAALENYCPARNANGLVEIGDLKKVINARIGRTDPWLQSAAHRLHTARNALAHLTPLPFSELTELAAACQGLR